MPAITPGKGRARSYAPDPDARAPGHYILGQRLRLAQDGAGFLHPPIVKMCGFRAFSRLILMATAARRFRINHRESHRPLTDRYIPPLEVDRHDEGRGVVSIECETRDRLARDPDG